MDCMSGVRGWRGFADFCGKGGGEILELIPTGNVR